MTGEIREAYLSEVYSYKSDESQTTLSEFSENDSDDLGTTIAVVIEPTGGITDVCDEFFPELGMPIEKLEKLRELRNEIDSKDDTECHNKAVSQLGLEEEYKRYIKSDEDARENIEEIVHRVNEGEKITLVCFEKKPKWCHRHILKKEIEKRIDTKE